MSPHEKIRQFRERTKVTQAQVAQAMGVSRPFYAAMEAGRERPGLLAGRDYLRWVGDTARRKRIPKGQQPTLDDLCELKS